MPDADREARFRQMREAARSIFSHALVEASITKAFRRHVECDRGVLRVREDLFDLHSYARVLVISLGKAGRRRWLGKTPHNRGVSMNPVDHPHGGGEGKTSGGRHPVTPWGQPTRGYKTRNNKRTNRFIVNRGK